MNTEDLHRNMIAFGEWILNNEYGPHYDISGMMLWEEIQGENEYYTTEQLFQIYLKALNND